MADDKESKGLTVDIQKQVETIRKTLGDLKAILDQLNTARSVAARIINNTDLTLTASFQEHESGDFWPPPPQVIAPRSGGVFGSQSRSGALFTGAVGTVHYEGDGLTAFFDWNNPWAGENSSVTAIHSSTGRYREWTVAGAGNEKAQFEYTVFQIPEEGSWRSCRDCQTLYFDGVADKGSCPARLMERIITGPGGGLKRGPGGGKPIPGSLGHRAEGFEYFLSHSATVGPPPNNNQTAPWCRCTKCFALFYDGSPQKGACPGGGGHSGDRLGYLVPYRNHSQLALRQQDSWRICDACYGLFFEHGPILGRCSSRGDEGHEFDPASHNYALNYR
ncbi:hypothetical protein [Arthrobacter sp. P2b]|uniref:hypothetical protein n=1 Tax=Arthrobacter sp. P2b TaxID=1938741 RepID=UPI0009A7EB21|nr:hypothetical protein [Arthrobacter sp. P2b]